jgi:hypothetical protein
VRMSDPQAAKKSVQLSERAATVGRTLLYTYSGKEHEHMKPETAGQQRPAVIVRTWGSTPGSVVNVQVFTDGCNDVEGGGPGADGSLRLTSLGIAAEPTAGYLHWPELTTAGLPPRKPVAPVAADGIAFDGTTSTARSGDEIAAARASTPKAPKARKPRKG